MGRLREEWPTIVTWDWTSGAGLRHLTVEI